MKNLVLSLMVAAGVSTAAAAGGGDIGGNISIQQMQQAFRMSPQRIHVLRDSNSENQAFRKWMNSLSPQQKKKVLEKVFEFHILPQLDN